MATEANNPASNRNDHPTSSGFYSSMGQKEFNFQPDTVLFERYKVLQRIGKGGMSEVYRVQDILLDKETALKILLPQVIAADEKAIERFLREARILRELYHPNIVRMYHVGLADSMYYLELEYVPGKNLHYWMSEQQKPIPLVPVISIGKQLCDALEYAHAQGVIHRDIKPGNIIMTASQQVKLLDFGIARLKTHKDVTMYGVVMGTLDYMAPERFDNADTIDVRTDVYSLGAVLYELVTGSLPRGRLKLPSAFRQDIPEKFDELIDTALSNNPADRFRDAQAFGKALQQILDSLTPRPVEQKENRPQPPLTTAVQSIKPEEPLPKDPMKRAEKQAAELLRKGDIDGAITIWQDFLRDSHNPGDAMIVDIEIGNLKKLKNRLETHKTKARTQEAANQLKEAWFSWNEVLEITPADPQVRDKVADIKETIFFQALEQPSVPTQASQPIKHAPQVSTPVQIQPAPQPVRPIVAPPKPQAFSKIIVQSIQYPMILIPEGTFMMGSPGHEEDRSDDEKLHEVTLTKPFYMGATQVTQEQWTKFMVLPQTGFKGATLPIESVNWHDVVLFCNRLSANEKLKPCYSITNTDVIWDLSANGYRLPTEAEWEYACRAATDTPFNTGDNLTTDQANYNGDYPYKNYPKGIYREKTTPVGSFKPNAWGLYDMHGNVFEWCWDWYGDYPTGLVVDPSGPSTGSLRVVRGGSWNIVARDCRSANRGRLAPGNRFSGLGFRLSRFVSLGT